MARASRFRRRCRLGICESRWGSTLIATLRPKRVYLDRRWRVADLALAPWALLPLLTRAGHVVVPVRKRALGVVAPRPNVEFIEGR